MGKSIPVPGTNKRRRPQPAHRPTTPSPSPAILAELPQSPANNDDPPVTPDIEFGNLFNPTQLMEIADGDTSPDPMNRFNGGSLAYDISNALIEHQPEDAGTESPLHANSKELDGYLDFSNILGPSIDILRIPDELKFIMQYRESKPRDELSNLLT